MGLFGKKHRKQDPPAAVDAPKPNPEPPSPAPPRQQEEAPPAPDPVKELQRLENMRDRGLLSPEEFTIEKRKVLSAQSYRRI
jgi:Short C-terminal domain